MTRRITAFTLLELVIALAIAATLAVFAIPAYRNHIARAHRIDAATALYRAAQFVESGNANPNPNADTQRTLPPGLDRAPESGTAMYQLSVLPADATNGGYAIQATPVDPGPMSDDACGTFVLDATGARANRGAGGAGEIAADAVDECWSRR